MLDVRGRAATDGDVGRRGLTTRAGTRGLFEAINKFPDCHTAILRDPKDRSTMTDHLCNEFLGSDVGQLIRRQRSDLWQVRILPWLERLFDGHLQTLKRKNTTWQQILMWLYYESSQTSSYTKSPFTFCYRTILKHVCHDDTKRTAWHL